MFEKAYLTFKFQLVYSPSEKDLVHLNDPVSHKNGHLLRNYSDLSFLGERILKELAHGIAKGEIDPNSKRSYAELI